MRRGRFSNASWRNQGDRERGRERDRDRVKGERERKRKRDRGAQLLHGERDEIDGDATGRVWEILRIVSGVI